MFFNPKIGSGSIVASIGASIPVERDGRRNGAGELRAAGA